MIEIMYKMVKSLNAVIVLLLAFTVYDPVPKMTRKWNNLNDEQDRAVGDNFPYICTTRSTGT